LNTPTTACGIVAARDLFEDVAIDLDDLAAGLEARLGGLLQHRVVGGVGAVHQDLGRVAAVDRLDDDLQALGQEQAALLAFLAHMQGADGLDGGVATAR
jgi:hypothetical protein